MCAISSQKDVQRLVEIKTFVFFDLETTGFIHGSSMPKITEMSLVALSRNSLFTKDGSLPRVMHKLTIPLQPLKLIPLEVSQITGLYNDLLEYEKPFDDCVYQLLNGFITRLCPPVCFVAHNGIRFDYPILLSALNRIGRTLSEDILCIDSLDAFKSLFYLAESETGKENIISESIKNDLNMFEEGYEEELAEIVDLYSISTTSSEMKGIEVTREKYEMDPQSMQKANETTPTHQIIGPMNMNGRKQFTMIKGCAAKKQLPFTHSKPVNFKLDTIYEHLVGIPPLNSHSAEGDCLSLLICVMKLRDSFIRWADLNASPLAQYAIKRR